MAELESAMDALSLDCGQPTLHQTRKQVRTELAAYFRQIGQAAADDILPPIMSILDDFARPVRYPPHSKSVGREGNVFDALGSVFSVLGRATYEQQMLAMRMVKLVNCGQVCDKDDDLETTVWMGTVEQSRYDQEYIQGRLQNLLENLTAEDEWEDEMTVSGSLLETPRQCKMLEAMVVATDVARIVFERENLRRHLAVSVLSNQRKTLDVIGLAEELSSVASDAEMSEM